MTRLLVMHLGSRGAGPRMLHDFAAAAAGSGRCETSLAYYGGAELAAELHALGRPELVAPSATASGALAALQRLISNLVFARSLRRFALDQGIDAVYAVMDNPLQILPTLALRTAGLPVLGSAHDAERHAGEESRVMEALMRMRPYLYTGLMTYSGTVARLMRAKVRHPDRVFMTVHAAYGSDAAPASPRRAVPVPTRVGFFGRILRYKGVDRLADAVALLRAEGRAVELAVHGRGEIDADLAARLRQADAKVDNRWIEEHEVGDIIRSFDVVAIPYSEASQSGIVGYAMNAGVPIVATPLPGLVEQVEAPGVGITAADMRVESFAAALVRVIDDHELYRTLSARGPLAARTHFGWSQVVDDVLAATDALLAVTESGVLASWRRRLVRFRPADRRSPR